MKDILDYYVTSQTKSIFVLKNLPEVIKGALFSRYSRSRLGLRELLLKEFIHKDFTPQDDDQTLEVQKAQDFYDRILDGYGDDSIGELGGAHLAVEEVSMLATKEIQDRRIGGSPLEKSTRYIYFDEKVDGNYKYYREPKLMSSKFKDLYVETCDNLFNTYCSMIAPLTEIMEKETPRGENTSQGAYNAAVRAKVCDCLRGLLPAATQTNMGVFGNGRFFEYMLNRLHTAELTELKNIGETAQEELAKVIPSFVRRANPEHYTHQGFAEFAQQYHAKLKTSAREYTQADPAKEAGATLVDWDASAPRNIAAALLYQETERSLPELRKLVDGLSNAEVESILDVAASLRQNRRHKSPRALENSEFTFEVVADFGCYRDLHRHRTLTQERQRLTCDHGYDMPRELVGTSLEAPFREALENAKSAYDKISSAFPEEAQYVVPMAYNVRWYIRINLRALQWMCELRSAPAGHTAYRYVAQCMAKETIRVFPQFERFFKFMDYEGHSLGRLGQEERRLSKAKKKL